MIPVSKTVSVRNTEHTYPVLSQSLFSDQTLRMNTKIRFTVVTVPPIGASCHGAK
jgi:hypothetical protein